MSVVLPFRSTTRRLMCVPVCIWLLVPPALGAPNKPKRNGQSQVQGDSLDAYLRRAQQWTAPYTPTTGSLWNPDGRMSDLASDDKPRYIGDQITIQLAESTSSALQGSVQTQRNFSASSSVGAFLGKTSAASAAQNLFSPTSSQNLNGKGQTALSTTLSTRLGANVVAVLPNGLLVVEARRDVEVTNQHQTLILRGIVRRDDVQPNNVVLSTAISHLEVSLVGKGVISDGTRPPTKVVRLLLHIFGF